MGRQESHFVTLQSRGLLALPRSIRERLGLDRPGAQVEVVTRDDGVIELHPYIAVPAEQTWFWDERWQKMEREADAYIERGEVTTHESAEELIEHLDRLRK